MVSVVGWICENYIFIVKSNELVTGLIILPFPGFIISSLHKPDFSEKMVIKGV